MKILFMCVANSARSQIAEGLARRLLPNCEIQSAGSQPTKVNPYAIRVLNEKNIDISRHFSKTVESIKPEFIQTLNFIITLCAEEVCPIFLTKAKKLHWPFSDPATKERFSEEEMLSRFRKTRDEIELKIKEFKKEYNL